MQASNDPPKKFHYLLVAVWLLCTFLLAGNFIADRLVPFDPQGKLANANGVEILTALGLDSDKLRDSRNGTLVHITSEACFCSDFTLEHQSILDEMALQDELKVVRISDEKIDKGKLIPSVPAVALLDANGKLAYFGPYSEGLACTESNGLVEVVMNNLRHGFNPELVVNDTTGCYCKV